MEDTAGKYDDTVSVEQLNTLLERVGCCFHAGEECDLTVLNHVLSSMDLDTCVDFKRNRFCMMACQGRCTSFLVIRNTNLIMWIYSKGASCLSSMTSLANWPSGHGW